MRNNWILLLASTIVFICLFYFLGFNEVFFRGPFGKHFMRQTDSLSFASQYFNNGFDFFNPRLYNLKNIDGRAAAEFPLFYYLTAIIYSIVGKKYFILKLIHLIITYLGVFYFFKLAYQFLRDYVYAILIALFLFSSTIFNFYSFNYLPDTAALGFTLMGWYFIFKEEGKRNHSLLIGMLLFTIGSLIKVTYLISPISVACVVFYEWIFKKPQFALGLNHIKVLIMGLISVAIVFLWNLYAIQYNSYWNSNSFNTSSYPIWKVTNHEILMVYEYIMDYWYNKIFALSSIHFIILSFLLQVVYFRTSNFKITRPLLFIILGSFVYFILFYPMFKEHDYYFLAFMPMALFIVLGGVITFQQKFKNRYWQLSLKLILTIIVVSGINYSRTKLENRFNISIDEYSRMGMLVQSNIEEIHKLDIPKSAKFIIVPDLCQNGSLFYLNRMGWTFESYDVLTKENMTEYKELGADYLLMSTENKFKEKNLIHGKVIMENQDFKIFELSKHD